MLVLPHFHEPLTVGNHNGSNDHAESGTKVPEEDVERNRDIGQSWDDVEQEEFKDVVDRGAAVEDAEDLPGLATSVPRKRQVQEVVETEMRHRSVRVLHNWSPEYL